MAPYRVRFDLPAGSKHNPIHIDDEDQGTAAARATSPEMTAFPMFIEGMSEEPTHGLSLGVSQDDDQVTVSTERATPPPSLTEDMAEGTLHRQSPGIGQDQEQKITDSRVPSEYINATTEGDHRSRESAIGVFQGTDPAHRLHSVQPNEVQESASTPGPATSNYSGCNTLDSAAVESSDALNIFHKSIALFCPTWKIIESYPDASGYLEVRLRILDPGAQKRPAPKPEPTAYGGPGVDEAAAP
ncbi:hypothetical protein CNMCM5793_008467 [Aspergillus hiratsukae]|uniref:Uncharacterized protein n=1 Tax=Aspergillus hiratsukae TaxID=1194566 RepID=A0A8H6P7M6_9EURO|nr:hypothetical protein CNMCM5793_008467 [Aspergillus hiratsukae]KAF7161566.1 hypothetical protein CNMCM6106_008765 [Aspergillus hiratsukae]